ncbi:unnamed protein product [Sphenostylis stenocarpa]|uniref:mitogen-activated protein kinase kinase kinase n=1 Tax=Sphenostylis stenocarpa TaxID=92480 RepID=A0AA87B6W4_9FABA|nr:unnamed protein product [Sphenostylis stenocarpa]
MEDFLGSLRRSLVLRPGGVDAPFAGIADKLGSAIRKSRIAFKPPPPPPPIRWRKGQLIGSGAFGHVYMGMNLDSGELIAIKQVLIAPGSAYKGNTQLRGSVSSGHYVDECQANIRELEEEVKLLKNLKHPNIVRYLGTAREENSLNILLEFVPGGSISSLLGKFGSFPESVIRMYTKQLLLGLEYLHNNGIIHRDIKGANILVDNKGCIKLADFGASKKVVELATINGAKSMKGTPHWMSPEVILQTGHTISTDIWSVACTVIEMATGKPPWSQQYPQEVSAIFYIGTTKSHPPIPEHLSPEAKDFLLKCFHKEPDLRPSASELLQIKIQNSQLAYEFMKPDTREGEYICIRSSPMTIMDLIQYYAVHSGLVSTFLDSVQGSTCTGLKDVCQIDSRRFSTVYHKSDSYQRSDNNDDDMCQMDEDDFLIDSSAKSESLLASDTKSCNPLYKPVDDRPCNFNETQYLEKSRPNLSFSSEPVGAEDDEELTECKIRDFLDAKALELKKLQTPLYEEFFNISNAAIAHAPIAVAKSKVISGDPNVTSKVRSPSQAWRRFSMAGSATVASPGSHTKFRSKLSGAHCQPLQEIQPPELNESKETLHDAEPESSIVSSNFSERQRKWKEELVEELEWKREMIRRAGIGGKITSPKNRKFYGD